MSDWTKYLGDTDQKINKKKYKGPGCKRNKISKNRLGPCIFTEQDECKFCKRPRKKEVRYDAISNCTKTIYLE